MSKHKSGLKRLLGNKKAVVIGGLIAVSVAGGSVVAWQALQQKPEQDGGDGAPAKTEIKTKDEAIAAMSKPQLEYDREGASEALGTAAQDAKDPEEKASLYQRQAIVEYQSGNYEKAADLYEKAITANANPALAFTMADTYEKAGDNKKAVEYYQRAKEYYEAKDPSYSGRTFYIEVSTQKIKELYR